MKNPFPDLEGLAVESRLMCLPLHLTCWHQLEYQAHDAMRLEAFRWTDAQTQASHIFEAAILVVLGYLKNGLILDGMTRIESFKDNLLAMPYTHR